MSLQHTIAEHGNWVYAIAFLWAFFEGETFVLFGGLAAARGLVDPFLLFACVSLGSFCGDQCWFHLGRRFGARLLHRYPRWQTRVSAPLAWLARYNTWFILTFRFIYGIRNISSFAVGLSEVTRRRFMLLNFLGSLLWAASFIIAGYVCGGLLGMAVSNLAEDLGLVLLGGLVLGLALRRLTQRTRQELR